MRVWSIDWLLMAILALVLGTNTGQVIILETDRPAIGSLVMLEIKYL